MNREGIASEITADIQDGIYNNYPKLKHDLALVAVKLRIVNSELSYYQVSLLKGNGYV